MLEELEHAKARGAKIYAEVAGVGMSADAHHLTASHPEGLGAKLVMRNALEDAEMQPEQIDYINVHGTSTPVGDISEVKAIQEVFGKHAYELNISSTKSMTGHLLGAAGAVEAIASILAIKNGIVPDLSGMGARDAVNALRRAGMNARLRGTGSVYEQSLPAGTRVSKGKTITINLK